MAETGLGYYALTRWRAECARRFGTLFDLPVSRSFYHECRARYSGGRVLDIGAGVGQPLKTELALEASVYASLDTDPTGAFTYTSFDQIPADAQFALVALNQILEHLTLPEAFDLMHAVARVTQPSGQVMIGVPNAAHPVRYWGDATHRTNWPYEDLYGLVREAGLQVEQLARYGKRVLPRNPIKRYIIRLIGEFYRMDWCDSILLVARHESGESVDMR